jgi:hypothetical protein
MAMEGTDMSSARPSLESYALRGSFVECALRWAEDTRLPFYFRAAAGNWGKFALSQVDGARELHDQMKASDIAYYWSWKEAEGLPHTLAADAQDALDEDLEAD